MKTKPKEIHVGAFNLGRETVDLYATTSESGGSFSFQPAPNTLGRITVGLGYYHWHDVVSVLLHEAHEYSMTRHLLRFESCNPDFSREHAAYRFLMDHQQFTGVCIEVAQFICPALPELSAMFKRHRGKALKL